MGHTYSKLLFHCVFSTKGRRPQIHAAWQERLWRYFTGILDVKQGRVVRGGGVADHVHLLLELKPPLSLSDAVRLLKSNSSKWIHETHNEAQQFTWQTGYAAFSVSQSMADNVIEYIDRQAEHHAKVTFKDELRALLHRHGISFDESWFDDE